MQHAKYEDWRRGRELACANPYRLDVFASSVREVVAEAGGWVVDRVLAGWTVTFFAEAADDAEHAARILGSEVRVLGATPDPTRPQPYGIAVTSALYDTDSQLQKWIVDGL